MGFAVNMPFCHITTLETETLTISHCDGVEAMIAQFISDTSLDRNYRR